MASLKRYEQLSTQKEPAEEHPARAMAVPQKSKRRRRRSTPVVRRNHQQRGADRTHPTGKKKLTTDAEEDP